MKIQATKKDIEATASSYVRVRIVEKGVEQLMQDGTTRVLQVVSGDYAKVTPRTFRTLIRTVVQAAKRHKLEKIALQLQNSPFPKLNAYSEEWVVSTITENLLLATYEHTKYKSKASEYELMEVLICGGLNPAAKKGFERGIIIGESANICRDIANTTGGEMTPAVLADMAKKHCKHPKTKVTVLDVPAIKKLGMGGLMGVGQGAKASPRFIVIEYNGSTKKTDAPIVFVGKGVTFDTGGLQIKPGMSMYEMHMDMSGGASVIAAISAIARLGLKKNVVGLIPAAENAISGDSMRPGDVLRMMSGATVEVLHTDAEGRLILADALYYAEQKYDPALVVDIATLTGASIVAVGTHAHVIVTKSRKLEDRFRELGEESGDLVAPLPLWDEYMQYTKGTHADFCNLHPTDPRNGGTIMGAAFLANFIKKKLRWVHIDMAPRMVSNASDKLAKGATGEPTRLLVKIAESF